MRRPAALALVALLALAKSAAAAEPVRKPPVVVAFVSGVATAMLPLALGALHTANATTDGSRNVGYGVAGAGIALSPIVSHVVLGEYDRAGIFGAAPVAAEIAACSIMAAKPDSVFHGTMFSRTVFALLFSIDFFGATAGLVDVLMVGDRKPQAPRAGLLPRDLQLYPMVGRDRAGFVIGGTL